MTPEDSEQRVQAAIETAWRLVDRLDLTDAEKDFVEDEAGRLISAFGRNGNTIDTAEQLGLRPRVLPAILAAALAFAQELHRFHVNMHGEDI
jgi:hypothetical protein